MLRKIRQITPENSWNRLARNLIYDAKQILLYCGIRVPEKKSRGRPVDYSGIIRRITGGTNYGAIYDPMSGRIHFDPDYTQNILDQATRFDFPVYDHAFGPGGIAGFIHEQNRGDVTYQSPGLNHILKQAMIAKTYQMPFGFISARELATFEIEQFSVSTNTLDCPQFFTVQTREGIEEAGSAIENGHFIILNHTIFDSPLTLSGEAPLAIFLESVERGIPTMVTTQPFSGQNAPMTPYGLALLAFSEFLAGMAMAHAVNPETKIINGAFPTLCTPGSRPELKLGTVTHNFINYLVAYTSRLLDIASIQSGCTIHGSLHEKTILDTDYETVRAMILWEDLFEGWHMIRHCYGLLDNLACFSFEKAADDIAALRHIQSLDDVGITALLANNVRLNNDVQKADMMYHQPTLLFNRESGQILEVILETMETFKGDFGSHDHTLSNIPEEWF